MFKKILIANRGEIAVRVIKTCRRLGVKTVVVYSDADAGSMAVEMADETVYIGPSPAAQSYLVQDKIIDAVRQTGAEAIHPGFGFLSENAGFAKRLEKEGIGWIGPNAHAIDAMGDKIYVPRAIEYAGQVITVYDPIVHSSAEVEVDDPNSLRRRRTFDTRYVRCERPSVITGGELSLSMLDLVYNPTARTYQAPLQLKATGGIFIVDDLGRQAEPPQALVNRWIVPLEESKDILALQSGEKFEVPFDTLVVFSTNFHPNEIFDQAALRRIFYKIKIDGPNQENFLKIFALVARKKGMPLDEATLVHLLKVKYPTINNVYANYQPVFLIDQMISICRFEGIPNQMSPELIDRAWANMFVRDEKIVK